MSYGEHNVVREGVVAGFLSATVIALWLLIVDTLAGHAFFTPTVLGRGLLGILGRSDGDSQFTYVAAYTVFHYGAFFLIGIIVATVVHAARRIPGLLGGFLVLFVMFEMGFYGLTGALSVRSELRGLAWYQLGAANLLAAVVMLYFMWVRHPELKQELVDALEGRDA